MVGHAHGMMLPFFKGVATPLTAATADVATSETTTSTTYTDLATSGPAVTLSPSDTKDHIIAVGGDVINNTAGVRSHMSPSIAGAAAADVDSYANSGDGNNKNKAMFWTLALAVASGSTHTCKYRVPSGTGTFFDRRIVAHTL